MAKETVRVTELATLKTLEALKVAFRHSASLIWTKGVSESAQVASKRISMDVAKFNVV